MLLQRLLDSGFDRVLLLDADSVVLDSLGPVFEALDDHSIVLSPHRLRPPAEPGPSAAERNLLRTGTFNGGLMAVKESPSAREFLRWWWARLERHCRHDVDRGLHLDQRWLDLAPGLFRGLHVHRDPVDDVAYWNLSERRIELRRGRVVVRGRPCRLFHFSGYDVGRPDEPTAHLPGSSLDGLPAAGL